MIIAFSVGLTGCASESEPESSNKPRIGNNKSNKRRKKQKKNKSVVCHSQECKEARVNLKDGKNKLAIALFKRGLLVNPKCARAHLGIAKAEFALNEGEKALQEIGKAVALNPNMLEAYLLQASIYSQQQRHDKAISSLTQAIKLDPTLASSYYLRARAAYFATWFDDDDEAPDMIADLEKALALNPSYAEAHEAKGIYLASKHKVKEAIASFSKAIELKPTYDSYLNRAAGYSYFNEFDKALSDIYQAIKISPNDPHAYRVKAGLMEELERYDESV